MGEGRQLKSRGSDPEARVPTSVLILECLFIVLLQLQKKNQQILLFHSTGMALGASIRYIKHSEMI